MKKSLVLLGFVLVLTFNFVQANSLKTKAVLVYCFEDDVTPLCKAISQGDKELVAKILDYGIDINGVTYRGMTPLMYAARYNKVEIVRLLIEKGADLLTLDGKGFTALDHAFNSNSKESFELIKKALNP